MSTLSTYGATGLTCEHCVRAVTDEVSRLAGVHEVEVELVVGGVSSIRVASDADLAYAEVREAVDEAGYEMADHQPEIS